VALSAVLLAAAPHALRAQLSGEQHHERLVALARLDEAVRYFHPRVAIRASGWDSAFAQYAMRIADAPTREAYARELGALAATLRDPLTRLATRAERGWTGEWLRDSVLVLRASARGADDARLATQIAKARAVVVDARGERTLPVAALADGLLAQTVTAPPQRALRYAGFPTTEFNSANTYNLRWRIIPGEPFTGRARRDGHVAFIVDAATVLPPLAVAMRTAGRAAIIGVGTPAAASLAETYRVNMGEGVAVDVRVAERYVKGGAGAPADSTIADSSVAVATAARWAMRTLRPLELSAIDTVSTETVPRRPTSPAWNARYPAVGYRVLAAARLWGTIHSFYPYKALMGERWDAAFRAALPEIERAPDSLAYAKAIATLATHIHDSHTRVYSDVLWREVYGVVPAPVHTRLIGDSLVVTHLADASAARAGLRVGDVITSIDGERTTDRVERIAPYFISSTPQALRARIAAFALNGRDSTPARLTVPRAQGGERTVIVPRSRRFAAALETHRDGSIFRVLPGNVGYVDLERLTYPMVDSMFAVLGGTKGIVFDMRGYPLTPAWSEVEEGINAHAELTTAARFREPVVISPDTSRTVMRSFAQSVWRGRQQRRYAGRTALLLDETTISQAEHLAMHFRAANGTVLVGGRTTGANGGVAHVYLPGIDSVSFTGIDVRQADGSQLQRVGLEPDLPVSPTLAGVRAGRDEVLVAALKLLGGTGEVPRDTVTYVRPVAVAAASPAKRFVPLLSPWGPINPRSAYVIGVDTLVQRGGRASGHVRSVRNDTSFGAMLQWIDATDYGGHRVRFSAWLRTRDANGEGAEGGAQIMIRTDGPSGGVAFAASKSQERLVGTNEWTLQSVIVNVPAEAKELGFGPILAGSGELWIDDASLDIVDVDVANLVGVAPVTSKRRGRLPALNLTLPTRPANLDFEGDAAGASSRDGATWSNASVYFSGGLLLILFTSSLVAIRRGPGAVDRLSRDERRRYWTR
jgi:C-terminal processing protease CtpA/Prc